MNEDENLSEEEELLEDLLGLEIIRKRESEPVIPEKEFLAKYNFDYSEAEPEDCGEEIFVQACNSDIYLPTQPQNVYDKVTRVLAALSESSVEYVIIGGFAMAFRGLPRFTLGLDLFVKPTEENIKKLRIVLSSEFYDKFVAEITTSELTSNSLIRYIPENTVIINIISKIGERLYYEELHSDIIEINGKQLRVATLETLFRLKSISNRITDQEDLLFLEEMINSKSAKND